MDNNEDLPAQLNYEKLRRKTFAAVKTRCRESVSMAQTVKSPTHVKHQ